MDFHLFTRNGATRLAVAHGDAYAMITNTAEVVDGELKFGFACVPIRDAQQLESMRRMPVGDTKDATLNMLRSTDLPERYVNFVDLRV